MPDDKYEGIFRKSRPRQIVFLIALSLSLSLACLDLTFALLSKPECFKSFVPLFPPLATTAAVILAVFLAVWTFVLWPLTALLRWRRGGTAAALAVFMGSLFVFGHLAGLQPWFLDPVELPNALFQGVVVLAVSALVAFMVAIRESQRYWRASHALVVALPLLAAELLVFVWFSKYRLPPFFSGTTQGVLWGVVALMGLTLLLAYVAVVLSRGLLLLSSLAILVFVSPALYAFTHLELPFQENVPEWSGRGAKHVVLITVDALRRDMISAYYPEGPVRTPNIDALAQDGALFTQAYTAAPWTLPSITTIMTGLWPAVHGVTKPTSRVPDKVTTLAETLFAHGYRTAATGKNIFLTPASNIGQGFQTYDFYPKTTCFEIDSVGAQILHALLPSERTHEGTPEDLTDFARTWTDAHRDQPFFFWIHYLDPHMPYAPPAEFAPKGIAPMGFSDAFNDWTGLRTGQLKTTAADRDWIEQLYEGEVRYVDAQIGQLTAALKRQGIYDDTLIILTVDHGEEFWDHGGWEHGQSVYNELIWAPLVVKLPAGAGGGTIDEPVSLTALMPTVLDACAVAYRPENFSVASLTPLLDDSAQPYRPAPIFANATLYYGEQETAIFDEMKYVHNLASGREQLFDLVLDPLEQRSILGEYPDAAQRGRTLMKQYHADAKALHDRLGGIAPAKAEYDPQLEEQMRSLGYGR